MSVLIPPVVTEAEIPKAGRRAEVNWSLIQSAKVVNQAIEAARSDGLVKGSLSAG